MKCNIIIACALGSNHIREAVTEALKISHANDDCLVEFIFSGKVVRVCYFENITADYFVRLFDFDCHRDELESVK